MHYANLILKKQRFNMIIPELRLKSWDIREKRIFVRTDYNISFNSDGSIISDFRLRSSWPTLEYIIQQGGTPVVATHIGRPKGHDTSLSTRHLIPWFEEKKCTVIYLETIVNQITFPISTPEKPVIYLLENLRFFPGEESQDVQFSQQLAQLADFYVNDAFGAVHRSSSSITLVAKQFSFKNRSIGFLMKQELEFCNMLRTNPGYPFVMILGGGKGAEKIALAQSLLPIISTLIIYPAVCFSILKAQNKEIGQSLYDIKTIESAQLMLAECEKRSIEVVLPDDYCVEINGTLSYAKNISGLSKGISVGKETIKRLYGIVQKAETVFFNGMIGFLNQPQTLHGLKAIFETIAQSPGKKIISGGDSVTALDSWNMCNQFDYLSTGGGALLACLVNATPPGLLPLLPKF